MAHEYNITGLPLDGSFFLQQSTKLKVDCSPAPRIEYRCTMYEKQVQSVSNVEVSPSSNPSSTSTSLQGNHVVEEDNMEQPNKFPGDKEHTNSQAFVSLSELRRRIDWHIVPIMFACYTMQFLDKVLLNYAAVMGIKKDLKLSGNDFSNASTAFFVAYLVAELPNGIILQRMPAAKWLGANVILWGIATACTAAATDYRSLLASRIFLGIFEAAIAPSLMLISSMWYNKSEQAPRFSLWYCGVGVAQMLGGFISFGFQHVPKDASLTSWKIMFVVLGVVTVIVGIVTFIFLPDSPLTARFISDGERTALFAHLGANQTATAKQRFNFKHALEILLDVQLWLLLLLTVLISISSGVVTTYSATLIHEIGFNPRQSALLNTPSGLVSIASTLIVGYGIRHLSHRWAWLVAACIPGIVGGALMSFLPHSHNPHSPSSSSASSSSHSNNKAGLLLGIYLVNTIVATLPIIYHWVASNTAGATKRPLALALIAAAFSVGNIIGPQTFQARDAPDYRPAKIAVLATQAGGALVAGILAAYYLWENGRRDSAAVAEAEAAVEHAGVGQGGGREGMTDKEDKQFRYVF